MSLWVSVAEAAEMLGVSRATMYWRISQGTCKIPYLREGEKHSRIRFRRADVELYIKARTVLPKKVVGLHPVLRRTMRRSYDVIDDWPPEDATSP